MYFGKINYHNLSEESRKEIRKVLVSCYLRNDILGIKDVLRELDYETRNIFCATNPLRSSAKGLLCGSLLTGNVEIAKCLLSHGISPMEKESWVKEGLKIAGREGQCVSDAKNSRRQCLLELTERLPWMKTGGYLNNMEFLDSLKEQMLLFKEKEWKEFEEKKTLFVPIIMAWLIASAKASIMGAGAGAGVGSGALGNVKGGTVVESYWGCVLGWLMENGLLELEGMHCSRYKAPPDGKRFFVKESVEEKDGNVLCAVDKGIQDIDFYLKSHVLFLLLCQTNELYKLGQIFLEKSRELGLYDDLFSKESLTKFKAHEKKESIGKKIGSLLGEDVGFSFIAKGNGWKKCSTSDFLASIIEQEVIKEVVKNKDSDAVTVEKEGIDSGAVREKSKKKWKSI